MTVEEFILFHKGDSKKYNWYISQLKDCCSKEFDDETRLNRFKVLCSELMNDILDDECEINEFLNSIAPSKPVVDKITQIKKIHQNAFNQYLNFKQLFF